MEGRAAVAVNVLVSVAVVVAEAVAVSVTVLDNVRKDERVSLELVSDRDWVMNCDNDRLGVGGGVIVDVIVSDRAADFDGV